MTQRIVALRDVASEVYDYGQYLTRTFTDADLREPGNDPDEPGCGAIRLQLHKGSWAIHTGDAQYDQDGRGSWGAGYVPRGCTRAQARDIARELIREAMEYYDDGDGE